jgi:hypothetical protein
MEATTRVNEALARLRDALRATAGVELTDLDAAELAGLEEDVCRALLQVLYETGALEKKRRGVFVCRG